jgi:acetyl esterase/lipase
LGSNPFLNQDLASPGSYVGYPKTFISIGDAEAFQRECEQLAQLLQTDGADITLDIQKDAVHDFWGAGEIVPSEAARKQLAQKVYQWIDALTE